MHATAVTARQSMPAGHLIVRTMASRYGCCALPSGSIVPFVLVVFVYPLSFSDVSRATRRLRQKFQQLCSVTGRPPFSSLFHRLPPRRNVVSRLRHRCHDVTRAALEFSNDVIHFVIADVTRWCHNDGQHSFPLLWR